MKVGFAFDPWKVKIAKKHFDRAGYVYEATEDTALGITMFTLEIEDLVSLKKVCDAVQREAFNTRNTN